MTEYRHDLSGCAPCFSQHSAGGFSASVGAAVLWQACLLTPLPEHVSEAGRREGAFLAALQKDELRFGYPVYFLA